MPFCAMYVKPESGIDMGRLLRKALAIKGMTCKTAAIWMVGPNYEPKLSRALNGQGPLDMHAVANLPLSIIWKFVRLVIAAKLKQWESEVLNERRRA